MYQIYEAVGDAYGESVMILYGAGNYTKFTYSNSQGDRTETYSFDNFGRFTRATDEDGAVSYATYTNKADQSANKVAETGSTTDYVENLLTNSSAEKATSAWVARTENGATVDRYTPPTGAYMGQKVLRAAKTSGTAQFVGCLLYTSFLRFVKGTIPLVFFIVL